jgi:hypothetical protein
LIGLIASDYPFKGTSRRAEEWVKNGINRWFKDGQQDKKDFGPQSPFLIEKIHSETANTKRGFWSSTKCI